MGFPACIVHPYRRGRRRVLIQIKTITASHPGHVQSSFASANGSRTDHP